MNRKGITADLGKIFIAMLIAIIVLLFYMNIKLILSTGTDDLKEGGLERIEEIKYEEGWIDNGDVCSGVDRQETVQVVKEAATLIEDPPFGDQFEEFLLAIAWVESNFDHCRNGMVIKSPSDSTGVMQITDQTADDICDGVDVTNIIDNTICGAQVVKSKYYLIDNPEDYERLVNEHCDDPQYRQKYLSYDSLMERTARAYNSMSCTGYADVDYVEKVMDAMLEQPWTKI